MNEEAKLVNGHYELPLPLRDPNFNLPNNKQQAVQRAQWLKKKLLKNKQMHDDYINFIKSVRNF